MQKFLYVASIDCFLPEIVVQFDVLSHSACVQVDFDGDPGLADGNGVALEPRHGGVVNQVADGKGRRGLVCDLAGPSSHQHVARADVIVQDVKAKKERLDWSINVLT